VSEGVSEQGSESEQESESEGARVSEGVSRKKEGEERTAEEYFGFVIEPELSPCVPL
jgi:hypothetical protein